MTREILKSIGARNLGLLFILFLLVAATDLSLTLILSFIIRSYMSDNMIATLSFGYLSLSMGAIAGIITIFVAFLALRKGTMQTLNKKIYSIVYSVQENFSNSLLCGYLSNMTDCSSYSRKGVLIKKLGRDVDDLINGLMVPVSQLMVEIIVSATLIFLVIIQFSWLMAIVSVPLFIAFALITVISNRRTVTQIGDIRYKNEKMRMEFLSHLESSLIDILIYKARDFIAFKLRKVNQAYGQTSAAHILALLTNRIKFESVLSFIILSYLVFDWYQLHTEVKNLSDGQADISILIAVFLRVMPAVSRISQIGGGILFILPTIKKLFTQEEQTSVLTLDCKNVSISSEATVLTQFTVNRDGLPLFSAQKALFKKGTFTSIFGESGCGKSSFLLALYQLLDAGQASGVIYLRQNPGFIFPDVRTNILLGEKIDPNRFSTALTQARLPAGLIEKIESESLKIEEMSGGQIQRLNLARAYYHNAKILLLDEFTSSLDQDIEREILQELSLLCQQGVTVICTSHRQAVLDVSDQIIKIENKTAIQIEAVR